MTTEILLTKLAKLFNDANLIISKYFSHKNSCKFIELISSIYGEKFLLHISKKYTLSLDNIRDNVFIIHTSKELSNNEEEKIKTNDETIHVAEKYQELKNNSTTISEKNIEKTLMENYDKPINILNTESRQMHVIRDIKRQISRLKYCVKNIDIKMGILFKEYIYTIDSDNNEICYIIENFPKSNKRKLLVIIDIEYFYQNLENFMEGIRQIKNGLLNLINANHQNQIKAMHYILSQKQTLSAYSEMISAQEIKYKQYINCFEELLPILMDHEKETLRELNTNPTNNDRLRSKLFQISEIRDQTIESLLLIKNRQDDIALIFDKIFFDNTIFISNIITNFKNFEKIYNNFSKDNNISDNNK